MLKIWLILINNMYTLNKIKINILLIFQINIALYVNDYALFMIKFLKTLYILTRTTDKISFSIVLIRKKNYQLKTVKTSNLSMKVINNAINFILKHSLIFFNEFLINKISLFVRN